MSQRDPNDWKEKSSNIEKKADDKQAVGAPLPRGRPGQSKRLHTLLSNTGELPQQFFEARVDLSLPSRIPSFRASPAGSTYHASLIPSAHSSRRGATGNLPSTTYSYGSATSPYSRTGQTPLSNTGVPPRRFFETRDDPSPPSRIPTLRVSPAGSTHRGAFSIASAHPLRQGVTRNLPPTTYSYRSATSPSSRTGTSYYISLGRRDMESSSDIDSEDGDSAGNMNIQVNPLSKLRKLHIGTSIPSSSVRTQSRVSVVPSRVVRSSPHARSTVSQSSSSARPLMMSVTFSSSSSPAWSTTLQSPPTSAGNLLSSAESKVSWSSGLAGALPSAKLTVSRVSKNLVSSSSSAMLTSAGPSTGTHSTASLSSSKRSESSWRSSQRPMSSIIPSFQVNPTMSGSLQTSDRPSRRARLFKTNSLQDFAVLSSIPRQTKRHSVSDFSLSSLTSQSLANNPGVVAEDGYLNPMDRHTEDRNERNVRIYPSYAEFGFVKGDFSDV